MIDVYAAAASSECSTSAAHPVAGR
jgi:hypothetical protein